jgi:hypothetical protein
MGKVKQIDAINNLIKEAIATERMECKRELYMMIKDLEDSAWSSKDILSTIKAYLLGRKPEEMLFEA